MKTMKRIFYLFTLALLGLNFVHSQDLTTLTQEGRQWSTEVEWPSFSIHSTDVYRMEGDTTLDDKSYKKIYYYHTRDLSDRKLYPYYACRQEGKKVFIYFYTLKEEKLFFDFSLNVGDSLYMEEGLYRKMRVTHVGDTIINGRTTRYLRLYNEDEKNWNKDDIWVEGIGSLDYGISWFGMTKMFGTDLYTLLCCHENGDLLWKRSETGECFAGEPKQNDTIDSPWNMRVESWWVYGLFDDESGCCLDMKIRNDTLIAGKMCKQLRLSSCLGKYFETQYIYPCGDSLFYYNYDAQEFFLLLDLSAKIGDTVRVHNTEFKPNPGFDPYNRWHNPNASEVYPFLAYKIVALDTMKVGDLSLRRQKVEPVVSRRVNGKTETSGWAFPSSFQDQNYIVERIGSLGGFFGEKMSNTSKSGYYKLNCFWGQHRSENSENRNVYRTYITNGVCFEKGECDNGAWGTAVEPTWEAHLAQWQLSPQPSGETVQAVCSSSESTWQKGRWYLHDLTGKRLQSGAFTDGCFEVSLRGVPHGMYMIEIRAAQGNGICRLKCVKGL